MIKLTPFAISGIAIIITYLPLFTLILLKGKTKISRIYSMHIFAVLWWGLGAFFIGINRNSLIATSLMEIAYVGVILIPVFFLHSVQIMINQNSRIVIFLIYSQAIYFIISTLSHNIFFRPKLVFHSLYFNEVGINYLVSFISWVIIAIWANYQLILYYQKFYTKQKKQILYLIIAIIGFIGGISNFIPHWTDSLYPYGNFFIPLHSLIITYVILKYQFLDIVIVIKKSLVYSAVIAVITIFYFSIVLILEKTLQILFAYQSILTSILVAALIAIILIPFRNKIQHSIDRMFFKGTQVEIAQQNKLLLQEIAKTEKLKAIATLASGMAHEIKNPLTAIKTFSEYLPRKINDKEFLLKFAPLLQNEVERINNLVHNLLDFAKPAPLNLQKTEIHKLLTSTLNFLDNDLIKNNIEVIYKFCREEIISTVDPNQLKQAFLNLFLNAIEAMPQGGTLTIQTTLKHKPSAIRHQPSQLPPKPHPPTPRNFILSIADTGVGIPKEDLTRIFDPFFTKKDSGTGLGLSITHGIIMQHGGTIRILSESGQGTEVIVEFPVEGQDEVLKVA